MNSVNAKDVAKLGVNIEITEDAGFNSVNVKDIIKIVVSKNKHITVNAKPYNSVNVKEMAKLGGDNITIKI